MLGEMLKQCQYIFHVYRRLNPLAEKAFRIIASGAKTTSTINLRTALRLFRSHRWQSRRDLEGLCLFRSKLLVTRGEADLRWRVGRLGADAEPTLAGKHRSAG